MAAWNAERQGIAGTRAVAFIGLMLLFSPFLFIAIFAANLLLELALRHAILADQPVFDAVGTAWRNLRDRFLDVFLMWLVQLLCTLLFGFVIAVIAGIVLVPAVIAGIAAESVGLGIAQTVFDGGRLDSQRKAAIAAYERAAAQYRGVVLSAFQDVANALRALQADADTLRAQVAAEQTAAASLRLSEQQYQLGAVNYLILLNAQQTYQTAVINRLRAQAARYSDTAALFQALGGGWWNRNDVDPKSMGTPSRFALPPVQDIKLPRAGR